MHAIAGGPKNFLDARSPPPWDVDVATLETCYSAVCVIAPDFVAVGRTVWRSWRVPKNGGCNAGARSLGMRRGDP